MTESLSPPPPSLAQAAPLATTPPAARRRLPEFWTRPVSYRAQCWIAWGGLSAFAIRGVLAWRAGGEVDVERLGAAVLSVCWGIDLLRGRSPER